MGGNYIIIVPSERLEKLWKEMLSDRTDCYVYVVNTWTMSSTLELPDNIKMIIYDEGHHYLNPTNLYFSTAIPKVDSAYKLILSATLSKEHLAYAASLGFVFNFELPVNTAHKLGLVADYKFYNIGVDFTEEEKQQYIKLQNNYKNHLYYFEEYIKNSSDDWEKEIKQAPYLAASVLKKQTESVKWRGEIYTPSALVEHISKVIGIQPFMMYVYAKRWRNVMGQRARLFYNAIAKLELANHILSLIPEEKAVVFCSSKINADWMAKQASNRISYHSGKSNKGVLASFKNGSKNHLCAIGKVDEGDLDDSVCWGVQTHYQSVPLKNVQRIGRFIRIDTANLSKTGILVSAYIRSFEHNGVRYESVDEKWLKASQWKSRFIYWIDNLEEIEELQVNID